MKILILDPDPQSIVRLENILSKICVNCKVTTLTEIDEAISFIERESIDLLLADININGESIFKLLENKFAKAFYTIITTKRIDRAFEAFEYNVIDYLRKPVMLDRLEKSLDRFRNAYWKKFKAPNYIPVKKRNSIDLIDFENIVYLQSYGSYIKVFQKNGDFDLSDKTLVKVSEVLPSEFIRIHASYIVNSSNIQKINIDSRKYSCVLNNNISLPVSEKNFKQLKEQLEI